MKRPLRLIGGLLSCVFTFAGTAAFGQNVVTVCQHDNYGGYNVGLPVGLFPLSRLQRLGVVDNDLSSALVSSGYSLALFEKDEYYSPPFGSLKIISASQPSFNSIGFNDKVSSVVVVPSSEVRFMINFRPPFGRAVAVHILNADVRVSADTNTRLIQSWSSSYLQATSRFQNPNTPDSLVVIINPDPTAYNGNFHDHARVMLDGTGLRNNPWDVDIIVHETFHATQEGYTNTEGWITEGLAQYARYKWGVFNSQAGWSLPYPSPGESYRDGYSVTARFFVWLENKKKASFLTDLHYACLAGYTDAFWSNESGGMSLDQLWAQYLSNPTL